ncbi:MAG: winged helix-turn-helix transcriptional regulator [Anaerolineae bacterium]|nr:winged helix-turn-helix transcriptional regulator [Anaerolineae bacterium]
MDQRLLEEVNVLHAQICQGLSDATRILILYTLADASYYVTELAEALDVPQPTISRHLKVLRERGLVLAEREGNAMRYRLRDRRVIEALDLLRGLMADILAQHADLMDAV